MAWMAALALVVRAPERGPAALGWAVEAVLVT